MKDKTVNISLGGVWFVLFVAIKLGGTAFASWSWWWVLLPIVPCIVFILGALGVKF